jgi:hypothetical protein
VTEERERVEKALRECAEMRVPGTGDPWPAIRERVGGERMSMERTSEERVAAGPQRRAWLPQLVPNTPLGRVLAVLSVLIFGAGAYAASGPVGYILQHGLAGPGGPGAGGHTGEQPEDGLPGLRTEVGQIQTADGARINLDWAYADEKFVAVGLHTQKLGGAQKLEGTDSGSDPVVLEPSLWDDTVGNETKLPPHLQITDASGQDFDTVGGGTLLGPQRTGAEAVFDAPEGLQPGREHRFRLEVPLYEETGIGVPGEQPDAGPFIFVFEVPVLPAPTIEFNQKVEAEGITLTLERVVDSPLLPQAVVCFEPPDDEHSWTPWLRYDDSYEDGVGSSPQKLGDGCWSLMVAAPVEGRSTVTVTNLEGMPRGGPPTGTTTFNPKTIRGPWTFEFEAPGP